MTVTAEGSSEVVERETAEVTEAEPDGLVRYNLFERIVHWVVGITFVALVLSGMALAYPRLAWLSGLFGGGQTMRAAHPWIGVVFTVGLVVMLAIWLKGMLLDATDREWFRKLRAYARTGHAGVDTGRWNGGQKGYFWLVLVLGIVLLVTGIPLWFPSVGGTGIHEWSRLIHHAAYLLMVGGFIVHVLLSAFLFPGTLESMTTGRVTRAWAAWHHSRWFREVTSDGAEPDRETQTGTEAGSDVAPDRRPGDSGAGPTP